MLCPIHSSCAPEQNLVKFRYHWPFHLELTRAVLPGSPGSRDVRATVPHLEGVKVLGDVGDVLLRAASVQHQVHLIVCHLCMAQNVAVLTSSRKARMAKSHMLADL